MLTASEPIPAHRAAMVITELEPTDPRLAALLDTVWDRTVLPDLSFGRTQARLDDLAAAVLRHFGYQVRRTDRPPIDPVLLIAVQMTRIPEPSGCRYCGVHADDHGERVVPYPGRHRWVEPLRDQRELRVRALTLEAEMEVLR